MASSASTTTLILRNPIPSLSSRHPSSAPLLLRLRLSSPKSLSFPLKPIPISASISQSPTTPIIPNPNPNPTQNPLSGSTRTITTLFAISLAASKVFANGIFSLAVQLKDPIIHSAGAAFFAAARSSSSQTVNTPLTVVAAGMAKWLDIYSAVLMVRVLLSWFPNIPWDRQPLVAIRDLCDPYLNLFRNIIPPIFDTLDVSPLLAFAVLGVMASILATTR